MGWAQLSMGPAWRVGVDHDHSTPLVRSGPFRYLRNPIYSAMAIGCGGAVLLVPSAVVAGGWLVLMAFLQCQVRAVEEPFLTAAHGERYHQWARRAGRFMPGIGLLD